MASELPEGFVLDASTSESTIGDLPSGFTVDQPKQASKAAEIKHIVSPIKQTIGKYARPILEGIPAAGGAIIGSGLGPAGTMAGGGLGFAIGDELADTLDQYLGIEEQKPMLLEIGETAKNVALGATFEAGGQLAGQVLGRLGGAAIDKIKNIMPFTKLGVEKKAGKILAAETSSGPLLAKNAEEAWLLEDAIPGLKFSRAELTNDPNIIKFERAAAREPGTFAAGLKERQATNNEAIRNFIKKQKGTGTRDDVLLSLSKEKEAIETGIDVASGRARELMPDGGDVISSGETIRGAAKAGETAARTRAGELFQAVPEFGIDVSGLSSKIDEISTPMSKIENVEKNVPAIFKRMARVIEEEQGVLTPNDLQGFRSELLEKLRESQGSATRNRRLESRLSKMADAVDDELVKASEAGKRLEKKAISDKYPSMSDLEEYERISGAADADAQRLIEKEA
ncbi:MAG: hypothetical protein KJP07_13550, partial [Desulfatitalea sp.]|nr:hypothetical protein [Desulfatitalea sp.]